MANKNRILADREAGMTCREVAEKHGVSIQYVSLVCAKHTPSKFQFITETGCIYPNLRQWMNDEMVSKKEFLRRMGYEPYGDNHTKLRKVMKGEGNPRKNWIDGMLAVTGMSYEMMFSDTLWGIDDEK